VKKATVCFAPTPPGEPPRRGPAARPALVTESLEMSNVSIVEEMVAMIGAMRAYEAAQKAVQSHDQALARH
jgi:flagellar basal-body rod protein FlgG